MQNIANSVVEAGSPVALARGGCHEDKKVEATGADWVVCRDEDGNIHFATFDSNLPIPTRLPMRTGADCISFWDMVDKWRNPHQN